MEEIQEVECEGRRGSIDCCRIPASAKDLLVPGNDFPHTIAVAVANNEAVNGLKVEHHQVVEARRIGTRVTGNMTELEDEAESGERGVFEKLAIPLLWCT